MVNHKKIVLVLGNGVDLDLGRKTSYRNFAESTFWPFKREKNGLGGYLDSHKKKEKWFDLENLLREYASSDKKIVPFVRNIQIDEPAFYRLKNSLMDFIKKEEVIKLNEESIAVYLLKQLCPTFDTASALKVYSFNYTDLNKVFNYLNIREGLRVDCEYIHGTLQNNSIILGIDEKVNCYPKYEIFIKTMQPTYESHPILKDLFFADEIIFFGMSFGDIDYPYFQIFFKDRCDENKYYEEFNRKRIAIFTRDVQSGQNIKLQLMEMNERRLMQMYNFNELKFFYTEDGITDKLKDYLNDIWHNDTK